MKPGSEDTTVVIRREEFKEVRTDVKLILEKVNTIQTRMELHENRIDMLERVVYSGVGLILLGVCGAVLGLVLAK